MNTTSKYSLHDSSIEKVCYQACDLVFQLSNTEIFASNHWVKASLELHFCNAKVLSIEGDPMKDVKDKDQFAPSNWSGTFLSFSEIPSGGNHYLICTTGIDYKTRLRGQIIYKVSASEVRFDNVTQVAS